MRDIDRRKFLISSGVAGAVGLATGGLSLTWPQLLAMAARDGATPSVRSTASAPQDATATGAAHAPSGPLVLVTLYGGNDGLGTVVPYSDPALVRARPDLLYRTRDLHRLDDDLALNPGLSGLAQRWSSGQLAVVRGVGYPDPDHSHFRSMDIWQTASPKTPESSGWLGRWLDIGPHDVLRALNIGSILPPLAVGRRSSAAALSLDNVPPLTGPLRTAGAGLAVASHHDSASIAAVRTSFADERRAATGLASVRRPPSATGSTIDDQLQAVARCVAAGLPTRAYLVSQGGFDLHAGQAATQRQLLQVIDSAVHRFLDAVATSAAGRNAVVVIYSEFGRRVAANAAQGTDHGTSGPVLVVGRGVRGGFYGEQPSLTDLVSGDLKHTTDFRRIYAELIDRVLGADPEQVIGKGFAPLGLLA